MTIFDWLIQKLNTIGQFLAQPFEFFGLFPDSGGGVQQLGAQLLVVALQLLVAFVQTVQFLAGGQVLFGLVAASPESS